MIYIVSAVVAACLIYIIRRQHLSSKVREALPGLMKDEFSSEHEIIINLRKRDISVGPRLLRAVAKSLKTYIISEEVDDDSTGEVGFFMRYRRRKLSDRSVG